MAVKVRGVMPGQSGRKSRSNRRKFERNRDTFEAVVGTCERVAPDVVVLDADGAAAVALVFTDLYWLVGARVDLERVRAVVFV